MIVMNPRDQLIDTNKVRSEKPRTISGIVSGRMRMAPIIPLARNLYFTMAKPMRVPSTVAMAVTTTAILRLKMRASVSSGYLRGSVQPESENLFQM